MIDHPKIIIRRLLKDDLREPEKMNSWDEAAIMLFTVGMIGLCVLVHWLRTGGAV